MMWTGFPAPTIVVARVRNAVIEVDYGGYTSSSDLTSKRMSEGTARSGAVELTRGVIKALTA
jgi:hypothetical protein